jgi:tellurite resistance protein TehA-like permease
VRIRLADIEPTPDVFAVVMATGIISIAAHDHGYRWISDTLGVVATLGLISLIVLVGMVTLRRRFAFWDVKDPDVTLRLFTFVAACAVLDSRLDSHRALVWVLGAVALAAWLVLVGLNARNMSAHRWSALRDRARGAWELASVGTSGLAIVTTKVARHSADHWWLGVAAVVWVAALILYGLMTWLIVWRAVVQRRCPAREGGAFGPDNWILMGGMAIATLAGDNIRALAPAWLAGPVRVITVVTWVTATLWIPPLIYFFLHRVSQRPNALRFAGVWWAFVFPLGMYAAASYAMATETGHSSLVTVSLVFFWDALAAWLVVASAGLVLVGSALSVPADPDAGRP